jgi:hypothetical protein
MMDSPSNMWVIVLVEWFPITSSITSKSGWFATQETLALANYLTEDDVMWNYYVYSSQKFCDETWSCLSKVSVV